MALTWRQRLQQHPRLGDLATWPALDPSLVDKAVRSKYRRNVRVVKTVMNGFQLANVAEIEGLSPGRVNQLLNRCLGGRSETAPALWHGLVPNQVIPTDDPTAPARGRFARLLQDVPGLRGGLDAMLLDRLKDKPWAEVPSPWAYHQLFKNLLAQANWPLDAYPYTTNSLASESVRRDLHLRWTLLCQARKARRRAFTSLPGVPSECWLYDRIEIDEHVIDCEQSSVGIEIRFGEQLPPLRLSRLTVLAAIDVATDCVLGFTLVFSASPNQDDLLALLHQCLNRCLPRGLATDGLDLPADAGFPGHDPSLPLPLPRTIALDNAWMHHAHSVETFVTQELGATLSFGAPKNPTLRRAIETCFNRLNQRLSHRFASTTGSSVTDPKRESAQNRKGVPIVSLPVFEDALLVSLADANRRPRARLASATPMAVLHHQAERAYRVDVDDDHRRAWDPFRGVKDMVIHDRADPKRKPYVNFEYLRYKGPGLLAVPEHESKVKISYDRRDLRQVEVFRTNGEALGPAVCPGSWRAFPHGISTRRYLFRKQRKLIRASLDPLTDFLRQQRARLDHPNDVTKFLETYQEFIGGFGLPTSLWPKPQIDQDVCPPEGALEKTQDVGVSSGSRYWSLSLNPGADP